MRCLPRVLRLPLEIAQVLGHTLLTEDQRAALAEDLTWTAVDFAYLGRHRSCRLIYRPILAPFNSLEANKRPLPPAPARNPRHSPKDSH